MSFKNIVDQKNVVTTLKSALEKNRLPHGLLFEGPSGAGKKRMAIELAKVLLCQKAEGWEACEACQPCHLVDQKTHPDLTFLGPAEDSRVIKAEDTRTLVGRVGLRPLMGRSKVFIIDQAHLMNDVSQNTLLKTLEEPPPDTVFILVTADSASLLPTIRSRVQSLKFVPISESKVLDEDLALVKNEILTFILSKDQRNGVGPDLTKIERTDILKILEEVILYFRDLLLLRVGAGQGVMGTDKSEKEKLSYEFHEDDLLDAIESLGQAKEKVMENINLRLIFPMLWEALSKKHAC